MKKVFLICLISLFLLFNFGCTTTQANETEMQSASGEVVSAPDTEATPKKDLRIKGNIRSKIYHMRGCPNYNQISPENVVWFRTEAEARAAGYRRARNC